MSADGSSARPLVASRGQDQGAAWSPDGASIAFQSDRGGNRADNHIWLTRPDDTGQRRLTRHVGERPTWSRNGRFVVFTAGGLFVVRQDGCEPARIIVGGRGEAALADVG